jgi:hypothetical protein
MPPLCLGIERVRSPIYPQTVRSDTEPAIISLLRTVRTVAAQGIWGSQYHEICSPKPFVCELI